MANFIMQRDRVVYCDSGHVVAFKKGEPVYVPPPAHQSVMAVGAMPVDEDFSLAGADAPPVIKHVGGDDRKAAVFSAFAQLVKRNARGDFDAGGKPTTKLVAQLAGFEIDAKERNTLWDEFMKQDE